MVDFSKLKLPSPEERARTAAKQAASDASEASQIEFLRSHCLEREDWNGTFARSVVGQWQCSGGYLTSKQWQCVAKVIKEIEPGWEP